MMSRPLTAEQSAFFDTVRGAGAIYIAALHAWAIWGGTLSPVFAGSGRAWLHTFFFFTGFLIHRSLLKHSLLGYARSRVQRVIPPFAFVMALTIALWAVAPLFFPSGSRDFLTAGARESFSLAYFVSTLLLVNGFIGGTVSANGPLWTLALDVWLYAVAAMYFHGGRWRFVAALALLVICIRCPGFWSYILAFSIAWKWSTMHAQGRLSVPRWSIPAIACTAPFSYTLYITHFPLLLFLYGATGERPWMMAPSLLTVLALAAAFGPSIERSGKYLWMPRRLFTSNRHHPVAHRASE
jgi:peptidoglycan/LPS O-acetylase OafA/YrhL